MEGKGSEIHPRLATDAEMESLKKIMTELKIEDNNDPNAPEKPFRYTSSHTIYIFNFYVLY